MITAFALLMFFQSAPKPVTVIEPVTQPVLHCPSGWHVEVWHRAALPYGGLYAFPQGVDTDGYRPYSPPIVVSGHGDDFEHPNKCVHDPAEIPRTTGKGRGSDGDEPIVRSCLEGSYPVDAKCVLDTSHFSDAGEIIGTGDPGYQYGYRYGCVGADEGCSSEIPAVHVKPSDGFIMTEASLTIAKNVCARNAAADVWIFRGDWVLLNCSQLGAVFALDTDNAFDQMIPLMQSIRDGQKPTNGAKP
jgi:hypothetical protein